MNKRAYGFTIAELLIVIVVIAILAAITIVAYNGITQNATNATRIATGSEWVKVLQVYKGYEGVLPSQITGAANGTKFCLGTGFPVGGGGVARCQNYNDTDSNAPAESTNAALMTELRNKVGSLPNSKPIPAGGVVGPVLLITSQTNIRVMIVVSGTYTAGGDCGGGFTVLWVGSGIASCTKDVL